MISEKNIKKEGKRLAGRPSIYTEDMGKRICEVVRNTVRGLSYICDTNDDFPSSASVRAWLFKNVYPEFTALYNDSKRYQAEVLAEEVLDVAYNAEPHHRNGSVDKEKLKVDSLKWVAAHLAPKKWNDKHMQIEEEVKRAVKLSEEQIVGRISDILTKADERFKK